MVNAFLSLTVLMEKLGMVSVVFLFNVLLEPSGTPKIQLAPMFQYKFALLVPTSMARNAQQILHFVQLAPLGVEYHAKVTAVVLTELTKVATNVLSFPSYVPTASSGKTINV